MDTVLRGRSFVFYKVVEAVLAIAVFYASSALAYEARGSRDHPLFRRPPGYRIVEYRGGRRALAIPTGKGPVSLAGQWTEIVYRTDEKPFSSYELSYRFLLSLQNAGGEVVFRENPGLGGRLVVGKLARPARDVWVTQEVTARREYRLTFLEAPRRRSVITPLSVPDDEREAQVLDFLKTVERVGYLEFSAPFTSGSGRLSAGYRENFKKVAMLMEKDPSLKFRVSTYTDSDLKPADQRMLLRDRGAALLDALTALGSDRGRLEADLSAGDASSPAVPRGMVRLTSVDSLDPPLGAQ
jgi:outer membrane protein OmpA-like peptidoglycan-associated protein